MNIFDIAYREKTPLTIVSNTDEGKVIMYADAVTSVTVEQGLDITEHPVEDGVNITDHAQVKLKKVSLSFIVTEAPLTVYSGIVNAPAGMLANAVGGVMGYVVGQVGAKITDSLLGTGVGRIETAKKKIEDIVNNKLVVSITAKNTSVNNLMIEQVSFPDDVNQGNSLIVDMTLKEIRVVASDISEAVGIPNSAVKIKKKGTKQAQQVNEQKQVTLEEYIDSMKNFGLTGLL